ncbi:hypothetical protein HCA61_22385 [Rhodococcus sp. HNM0563]|uniref:hypothetical protein n=1 Tax=Rhodococcus sp. HNM0563 TaxID=2716339 RepID=UPI00146B0B20|nr:hypothetical protein [Rhodococcus sp. HNM0563]NLU64988.1 hypothetical protein [Rhodococcus sp. HNM0563]
MKTAFRFAALGLAAIGALTACGSEAAPNPSIPSLDTPTADATTTAPSTPPKSPRGGFLKELGQPGGIGCSPDTGVCDISFAITSLELADSCTGSIGQTVMPEKGKFLMVDMSVATAQEPLDDLSTYPGIFNEHEWRALDSAGITHAGLNSSPAFMCFLNSTPQSFSPASQYQFTFALEVPANTSTLIYAPFITDGETWEWPLRPTV